MTRRWKVTYHDGSVSFFDEPALLSRLYGIPGGAKATAIVPLKMVADYAVPRKWYDGGYSVLPYEVGKQPEGARKIEGSEREVEE